MHYIHVYSDMNKHNNHGTNLLLITSHRSPNMVQFLVYTYSKVNAQVVIMALLPIVETYQYIEIA